MSHYEPTKDEFLRQILWLLKFADPRALAELWHKWVSLWVLIRFWISYNIIYRYLLDIFLILDLGFSVTEFEFPRPLPWPELKGRYGISKYGQCIYDPPEPAQRDIQRSLWDLRYKATMAQVPQYNRIGGSMLPHVEFFRTIWYRRDLRADYVDAMPEKLALVEGKVINAAYVGFTCVGLGRVCAPKTSASILTFRDPRDWKTELRFETISAYESHVGLARVGYARVTHPKGWIPKYVADLLKQIIEDFWARAEPLARGVFYITRSDQMKLEGTRHQALQQIVINRVKDLLNRHGVFGILRRGYIAFALELMYKDYKGHRLWKQWKHVLTEDELIEKYTRMGLKSDLLREIAWLVKSLMQRSQ